MHNNQRTEQQQQQQQREIRARETEMSGRMMSLPKLLPCQRKNTGGERLATPVRRLSLCESEERDMEG